MTKRLEPVVITTTTHALAVAIYTHQMVLGALTLFGLADTSAFGEVTGAPVADAWAMLMLLAGFLAVKSAMSSRNNVLSALKKEGIAAGTLSLISAAYAYCLFAAYGIGFRVTTQSYTILIAIGCGFRVYQIIRDYRRAKRALEGPSETVRVLGQREGE